MPDNDDAVFSAFMREVTEEMRHVFKTANGEYIHGDLRYCQRCEEWVADTGSVCLGSFAVATGGGCRG